MNEAIIVKSSASGRIIILVSEEAKLKPDIRMGSPPAMALK